MKSILISTLIYLTSFTAQAIVTEEIKIGEIKAYKCSPDDGNFKSAVLYMHGSKVKNIVGGAPKETCRALAEAGYIGLSPMRPESNNLRELMGITKDAVSSLKKISGLDKVHIMGYSQGGGLAYRYSVLFDDIKSTIFLAGAPNPKGAKWGTKKIDNPILVMIAKNDTGSKTTNGRNLLKVIKVFVKALKSNERDVKFVVLPPYGSDGHKVFWEVGDYWKTIIEFLNKHS